MLSTVSCDIRKPSLLITTEDDVGSLGDRPSQLGEEQFLHPAESADFMTAVSADDLAVVTLSLVKAEIIPATDSAAQINSHRRLEIS